MTDLTDRVKALRDEAKLFAAKDPRTDGVYVEGLHVHEYAELCTELADAFERAEKAEADYQEARDTHDRLRAERDSHQREAIRALERAEKAEARCVELEERAHAAEGRLLKPYAEDWDR